MRSKFKWIFTLLVALTMQFSFAQEKTVSGVVSDNVGPIPGANVVVKGTTRSTQTDMDGKYSVKAKQGETLVFSFLGLATQEVKVGASNTVSVKLAADQKVLDEVTVTGSLGVKKRKDAVGSSFTVISAKEMGVANNPNAVRSLTGKVAGLQINNVSNGVDGNTSIKLRTPISFSTNGEALIVIDGIPSNSQVFASMPPSMIESVNVIKGAQGAAIYGEAGVSGVIVVTTKKAVKGEKVSVEFNSGVDFEEVSFVAEKQDLYGQGWSGAWDQYENGGWGELFDGTIRPVGLPQADGSYIEAPYSHIKDNIKQFYKQGSIIQNGVSLRVGSENAYASFSADNQLREFIVKGDEFKRSNFLFKGGVSGKKWSVDGQFNYRVSKTNQSNSDTTLKELQQAASNIPIGQFDNGLGLGGWNVYYDNPFWRRDNNRLENEVNFINANINLAYKINNNIGLKYNAGVRLNTVGQVVHNAELIDNIPLSPVGPGAGSLGQTSAYYNFGETSRNFYGDLMATFDYDLTKDINMSAFVGHNMRKNTLNRIAQGGQNLEIAGWYNIQNVLSPDNPSTLNNTVQEYTSTAEFASVDFGYKDYLFLSLTGRYDHVSNLLPSNRDFFYPSASISFLPSKWKDLSSYNISYLKTYANYTKVGSTAAISNYRVLNFGSLGAGFPYSNTGNSFNDQFSFVDANIKPEFYSTIEAGFVLGMFDDKVTVDFAAYQTNTTNAISNLSTSTASGNLNKLSNIGDVKTKGLDLGLTFNPFKGKEFNWTSNINFSTYTNEVTRLNGQDAVTLYDVSDANINGAIVAAVGESFPYLQGTDWLRDDQGRVIINDVTGLPSVNSVQQNIGKVNPDYILGFTNNFSYKGFGLAFTMDYRKGGKIFSETIYNMTWSGHHTATAYDREAGFLFPNSVLASTGQPNTTVATAAGYGANGAIAYGNTLASLGTHNAIDATAFKVREISLSYTLAPKFTEKLGLSSFRFSVNARNPFIILADDNKGYTDPEASSVYDASTTNASQRVTTATNTNGAAAGLSRVNQYPSTRTFGFAINVGF